MKLRNFAYPLLVIFVIGACKKQTDTKKDLNFASTTYKTLGGFDTTGKPDNLTEDIISPSLISFIDSLLPALDTASFANKNLVKSHPELFVNSTINDIVITKPSDVYMTFVSQGAGNKNTIGFYTYTTGQPPLTPADVKTITYAFPSAGKNTPLKAGDRIKLGKFNDGISIGFVLMQDAWNTITKFPNNNVPHLCTDAVLNPEKEDSLKQHAVLIHYSKESKLIFGFEDLQRTLPDCDNDFNDIVFYCAVNP